jgi:hypothetical protein
VAGVIQVPFGNTMVTRLAPAMGPEHYKTFGMAMPRATHWRPATCEEVDCPNYLSGWVTTVDLSTELGQRQHHYLTHDTERRPSVQRVSLTLVKFVYGPGFRCFRSGEHVVPLGRPPRLYVAGGDFRGNPRGTPTRVHTRAEAWVDEFATHQDQLATAIGRG